MLAIVPMYGTVVGTMNHNIANEMNFSLSCSFDAVGSFDDYFFITLGVWARSSAG